MKTAAFRLIAVSLLLSSVFTVTHAQTAVPGLSPDEVTVTAAKMNGEASAQKVSRQLSALKGVGSVDVDVSTHTVKVVLPNPSLSTLGRIWHAVEQGEGGPTLLRTAAAALEFVGPQGQGGVAAEKPVGSAQQIVIDNLHCKGCAQKIAARLYQVRGVTKVGVDLPQETLTVQASSTSPPSPWVLAEAVSAAGERPVAIRGPYGTLAIKWATKAAPKTHHQAQQTAVGGAQR